MYRSDLRVAFLAMLCATSSASAGAPKVGDSLPAVPDWLSFSSSSWLFQNEAIDDRSNLIDGSRIFSESESPVLAGRSILLDPQPLLTLELANEHAPTGILIEVMASPHDDWHQQQWRRLFEPIALDGLMVRGF